MSELLRGGRGRAGRLDRVLGDLLAQAPELEAAAVVSFDGLPMASALPVGFDEDRVAAMSAALLSLGERAAAGLGRGDLAQVWIEGEEGTVFLVSAEDEAVLVAVAARGAKAGLMMFEVRRAAAHLAAVLREDGYEDPPAPVTPLPAAGHPAGHAAGNGHAAGAAVPAPAAALPRPLPGPLPGGSAGADPARGQAGHPTAGHPTARAVPGDPARPRPVPPGPRAPSSGPLGLLAADPGPPAADPAASPLELTVAPPWPEPPALSVVPPYVDDDGPGLPQEDDDAPSFVERLFAAAEASARRDAAEGPVVLPPADDPDRPAPAWFGVHPLDDRPGRP